MKRTTLALFGAAMVMGAGSASAQIGQKMPEQAKYCDSSGKFAIADVVKNCEALYNAPTVNHDEQFTILQILAEAQLRAQDYTAALARADQAMSIAAGAFEKSRSDLYRTYALSGLKKDAEAVAALNRAIATDPKNSDALLVRGQMFDRQGKKREALADYDAANDVGGWNAESLNSACWIRAADLKIEFDKALRDCNRAVSSAPKEPNYLDSRGMVNLRIEEYGDAYKDYDAALKLNPKIASSLYGRAVAAMAMGKPGDADIAAAKAIDPKVAENYAARGLVAGTLHGPVAAVGPLAKPTVYDWGNPDLARRANDCGYYKYADVGTYADLVRGFGSEAKADAEATKRAKENSSTQAYCLRDLKRNYPGQRRVLEQAALNSNVDLDAAYRVSKAGFLADVQKAMWVGNLKDMSASALRNDVAKFRGFKTFAQACGSFDYSMPPIDNAVMRRRDNERMAFGKCAENYRENVYSSVPSDFNLDYTRKELDSYKVYVCSRYKVAGCIPDSMWRDYDEIATSSNVAMAKRIDAGKSDEYHAADDAVEKTNKWLEDVNAMVARYNANH